MNEEAFSYNDRSDFCRLRFAKCSFSTSYICIFDSLVCLNSGGSAITSVLDTCVFFIDTFENVKGINISVRFSNDHDNEIFVEIGRKKKKDDEEDR